MDDQHRPRMWWLLAVIATAAAWLVGAYMPSVSSVWVRLNVLTAAGHRHLAALPFAYPAVGVDGDTLCSLLGVLLIVAAAVRWISYFERHTPPPLVPPPSTPALPTPPPSPQR
ncbi:MAG: hypothetical protein PHQ28_00060 [Mycobacterium sp.]|nr:hypothetical protein [Mycobacterium sp.]